MKEELKKLEPDIRNIIFRGIAKHFSDTNINLIDDVSEDLVEYISFRFNKDTNVTEIIRLDDDLVGTIDVTECCKVGPITSEKYCSKCGRKIINFIK